LKRLIASRLVRETSCTFQSFLLELDYRLKELELVKSILDELERRISIAATKDRGPRLIDTIPGVGAYTALLLSSALDDVKGFPDSKHAYAYLGIAASLHQSGDLSYSGEITRRKKMVEEVPH